MDEINEIFEISKSDKSAKIDEILKIKQNVAKIRTQNVNRND